MKTKTIVPTNFMDVTAKIIAKVRNKTCINKIEAEAIEELLQAELNEVFTHAYDIGRDIGRDEGLKEGYKDGQDYGYSEGYALGYSDGYSEGHSEGYYDGRYEVQWHTNGHACPSHLVSTMLLGEVMELTDEAKYCVLVFGYVWLEMISLCVMSFLYL